MKKNILFLILFVFVATVNASQGNEEASKNNVFYTIQPISSKMFGQNRSDYRPIQERENSRGLAFEYKDIQLSILKPRERSVCSANTDNKIHVIRFKSELSKIVMQAELVHPALQELIGAFLGATFDAEEGFMRCLEQETKNQTVYFKLFYMHSQANKPLEFYFDVASEKIISDFGLQSQSQQCFSWVKYAIPFGMLAILTVWYFNKYKH